MTTRNLENLDPTNEGHGDPVPAQLADLGVAGVRLVVRPSVREDIHAYHAAGLYVLGTLTSESFPFDPLRPEYESHLIDTIIAYGLWYEVDAWQIGNEPEGEPPSSWVMSREQLKRFADLAVRILRDVAPGKPLVGPGLVSDQADWLEPIWPLHFDSIAVHPYGKNAEQARACLAKYRRYGLPLVVSEWNRPASEISAYVAMLDQETEMAAHFCVSDGMVEPYGLMDWLGRAKPEYYALKEALRVAEFVLGFKALADKLGAEVVGEPVEDEHYFPDGRTSLQVTTRGMMIYSKEGNQTGFLPFVQPK